MQSWHKNVLDAKKDKFIDIARQRLAEGESIVLKLDQVNPEADETSKLIKYFHQMAGAGGLFQLQDFCRVAIAAEGLALKLTKRSVGDTHAKTIAEIKKHIEQLNQLIDGATGEAATQAQNAVEAARPEFMMDEDATIDPSQARRGELRAVKTLGLAGDYARMIGISESVSRALADAGWNVVRMDEEFTPLTIPMQAIIVFMSLESKQGFQIVHRVRSTASIKDMPVIVCSARDSFDEKLQAIKCGSDAFFSFTEEPATIVERLEKLCAKSIPHRFRILLVEDDPIQASAMFAFLNAAGFEPFVMTDAAQFEDGLIASQPDLIILDVMLGDVSGFELAKYLRQNEKYSTVPVLFLTTQNQLNFHVEGARLGDDYLIKPAPPQLLIATIAGRLERYRTLKDLMGRDALTGVLTYGEFMKSAQRMFENDRGGIIHLLLLDIDDLAAVNERHGYSAGEKVLSKLAEICRDTIRSYGVTGRLGGDEFGILVDSLTEYELHQIANLLREEFERENFLASDCTYSATVSGVILNLSGFDSLQQWFSAGRKALEQVKTETPNTIRVVAGAVPRGNDVIRM